MKIDTKKKVAPLNKDNKYFNKLSELIMLRYLEFLRLTNHELLTLFWKIGVNVKSRFPSEAILHEHTIAYLADELNTAFGPFFNLQSIKQMVEFSTILTDTHSLHEFSLINWNHIQVLLNEKTLDGWKYYLRVILEQKLSADELAEQISSGILSSLHKINSDDKVKGNRHRKDSLMCNNGFNYKCHTLLQNFFREPLLTSAQKIMTPQEGLFFLNDDLTQLIAAAQAHHVRTLNSRFNMFLYEMSGMMNGFLESCPEKNQKLLLKELSAELVGNFGNFFNTDLLLQVYACSKKIPDILIFIRIANLVTWEHIIVLMSLEQIEYMLYYARLTADNGLKIEDLIAVIKGDKHKDINEALKLEKNRIDIIESYTSTTSVKKKGNNITKMTEQIVDFGDDIDCSKAILNVFENRYLVNFMKSFQHNDLVN